MEYTITKENFEQEVLQSSLPVLVDFWAPWCGPCRMLAPILEEFAQEYDGRAKVGKCNVDEQLELARQFGITSIPTVLLFREGKLEQTLVGYRPIEDFEDLLK